MSLFFRELGSPRSEAQTARHGVLGRRDEGNARERLRERAPRERVQSLTRVRWARARFSPGREVGATRAFEFRARARINLSLGWYRRQFSTSEVVHISGCCLQLGRRWPCGSFRERSGASTLAAFASSNGSGVLLLSWRFLYKRAFVFASAHLRESRLGTTAVRGVSARGRGQRASERQTPRGNARGASGGHGNGWWSGHLVHLLPHGEAQRAPRPSVSGSRGHFSARSPPLERCGGCDARPPSNGRRRSEVVHRIYIARASTAMPGVALGTSTVPFDTLTSVPRRLLTRGCFVFLLASWRNVASG